MKPPDGRHLVLRPALLLALAGRAGAAGQYSLIVAGGLCSDYQIPDVPSEAICYNQAAAAVSLAGVPTFSLNSSGFNGCLYNVDANLLMFGVSAFTIRLPSWRYVCNGQATTTITVTATTSTVTTTTVTVISTTPPTTDGYSLIDFNENCASYQIADVTTSEECFTLAAPYVGLGALPAVTLPGMVFHGCVYNPGAGLILFSNTTATRGQSSGFERYICRGKATTTTTTTETTTVTVTTTTSTTSTVTVTTVTTSTSTVTTSTSTITTETTSTSTLTATTSTASTSTFTGSSSTFTTTTTSTTSMTTSSTTTASTFTATTSTRTTQTTTWTPPGAAGFVGDDPLTIYNGVAKQFWLPDGELVQLLATSELRLHGSAFGLGSEQYIDRLVLTGPLGEAVARIAIRGDVASLGRGEVSADHFSTLNITLDWLGGVPLEAIPTPDSYAPQWGNVVFAFMRVPDRYIGEAQVEMMVIEGASARIVVMSVAGPGSGGASGAHLDFVLQLKEKDTCEGVLPELWGLRPFSNGTLALLEVPH